MGWQHGCYYVRNVKQAGRVVTEYVGGGKLGQLAALMDADHRAQRSEQAETWKSAKSQWAALDRELADFCRFTDVLLRLTLRAAGYHQHDRGEWRKRRDT